MYFAKANKFCRVTFAFGFIATISAPSAWSQGMMEAAGLMAMPKPIPGADTIKGMTRGFNAIPNTLPGQASGAIPAGLQMTMPDGTVAVDPKKAKELAAKADGYYKQAKQILANKAMQSPAGLRQAENLLRATIDIHNAIWGYADPNIPRLLNQLAGVYMLLKQPATAKACYQNALVYLNKKYGPGSAERYDTLVGLLPILVKEGNANEACSLQQQIALMKERKNGASDPASIQARLVWAATARSLDKPETADVYKQALANIDAAGPKIAPDKVVQLKASILPNYIEALKKQSRDEEVEEAQKMLSTIPPAALAAAASAAAPSAAAPSGTAAPPANSNSAPASASTTTTTTTTTTGATPAASGAANSAPASAAAGKTENSVVKTAAPSAPADLQPAPGAVPSEQGSKPAAPGSGNQAK